MQQWQSCEVFRSAPREAPPEFVLPVNTALRVKACSGGADMGRKDGKTYVIGAPKTQKRVLKMGATLWLCQQFAIENGPVEISLIFPLIAWWIFPVRFLLTFTRGLPPNMAMIHGDGVY